MARAPSTAAAPRSTCCRRLMPARAAVPPRRLRCRRRRAAAVRLEGGRMQERYDVLFLCTGNSARSILAESLLNHWGRGRFRGHSAGSFPKGAVHPLSLELLRSLGLPTEGLRSKSWDEFAAPGAPALDFVFTV